LRAIDTATESIDFQTFLWSLDTTGALVLDHLIRAANRGVFVKLLIDDTFLLGEDKLLLELHHHPNISYRVFNPYKRRANQFVTRALLNAGEFQRLDHRMHNKAMIVDNRVAILGGRNIADEYFGLHNKTNFRDLELLLGGKIVKQISQSFDNYWNDHWTVPIDQLSHLQSSSADLQVIEALTKNAVHVHEEETSEARKIKWQRVADKAVGGAAVLIVDKPPEGNPASPEEAPIQVGQALLELVDQAQNEIVIISAYLIPTEPFSKLIENTVQRGVRVRVLTNSIASNNHITAHSAYRNHVNELLEGGAELHEVRTYALTRNSYMLSPVEHKVLALHSKSLLVDTDKVFIGSPNLDPRSMRLNTEMGLLIESQELSEVVRQAVEPDFKPANAWRLQLNEQGSVLWVSDNRTLTTQPAASFMQRIEDWFFRHLPIEDKL
jgi:putative cardiolipin synthase